MGISNLKTRVKNGWHKLTGRTQWTIITIVILLVAVRISLPYGVKYYVNRQLAKIPEYSGHVDDIEICLWRGAYQIKRLKINKSNGGVPVPFFSTSLIDLSVQWKELFHGAIAGEVTVIEPQINFVSAPDKEQSQTGADKPWTQTLASLFPFKLNRFEIQQGDFRFRNFSKSEPVNIYITNLYSVATNLTNTRSLTDKLPAGLNAHGYTLGGGFLTVELKMDPLQAAPTFELNAELTNVDMVALNDFLRAYGKLDVARGNLSLFTSTASVQGNYNGYVKVLFKNLDIFQWEKERKKNVLDIFWEAVAGTLVEGFKNHVHDQLATTVPVSGSFTNTHVDVWGAAGSLLKNAFVRAIIPKVDPKVDVADVKKKK